MKTRVFENMNDLKNNRLGGHIKNNDISFVKENNSIIIGDNNVSNSILYPPILTMIQIDENYQFTEDITLLIQQENNLEEILKYCLIGIDISQSRIPQYIIIPFKLIKNLMNSKLVGGSVLDFEPDYENYHYIIPIYFKPNGNETLQCLEISKQFPYTIKIK